MNIASATTFQDSKYPSIFLSTIFTNHLGCILLKMLYFMQGSVNVNDIVTMQFRIIRRLTAQFILFVIFIPDPDSLSKAAFG